MLNISGNGLKSLCALKPFLILETLLAEENEIQDLDELVEVVGEWKFIKMIKLNENPVCKKRKYRDNIVVNCLELGE